MMKHFLLQLKALQIGGLQIKKSKDRQGIYDGMVEWGLQFGLKLRTIIYTSAVLRVFNVRTTDLDKLIILYNILSRLDPHPHSLLGLIFLLTRWIW